MDDESISWLKQAWQALLEGRWLAALGKVFVSLIWLAAFIIFTVVVNSLSDSAKNPSPPMVVTSISITQIPSTIPIFTPYPTHKATSTPSIIPPVEIVVPSAAPEMQMGVPSIDSEGLHIYPLTTNGKTGEVYLECWDIEGHSIIIDNSEAISTKLFGRVYLANKTINLSIHPSWFQNYIGQIVKCQFYLMGDDNNRYNWHAFELHF